MLLHYINSHMWWQWVNNWLLQRGWSDQPMTTNLKKLQGISGWIWILIYRQISAWKICLSAYKYVVKIIRKKLVESNSQTHEKEFFKIKLGKMCVGLTGWANKHHRYTLLLVIPNMLTSSLLALSRVSALAWGSSESWSRKNGLAIFLIKVFVDIIISIGMRVFRILEGRARWQWAWF